MVETVAVVTEAELALLEVQEERVGVHPAEAGQAGLGVADRWPRDDLRLATEIGGLAAILVSGVVRHAPGGFYNTSIAYDENSNPTSTIDNVHVRASTGARPFDVVYTLDANGDADYTDEADRDEPSANNSFDKENEWTARRIDKGGGYHDDLAYTYDATGNLTVENTTIVRSGGTAYGRRGFVYDAFGRMVQSTGQLVEGEPEVVTNYRYNGLGMRIMWQSDLDAGGTLEDSERTFAAYDARWRVVATFANDAAAPAEAFVHHAAGFGGSGGSSYIDSVILRDRDADAPTDESHTLEERRYFCQNWRADVVAVAKSDGTPVEYVRYSAYGEPTVYPLADVNMDGVVDSTDYAIWVNIVAGGAAGAEVVGADLNFDGTADAAESDGYDFYESYDANVGLSGKNHVSSPGVAGRLGYAGYEWDDVLKADHVRHRVYFPDIGRWSRRDPVGYVHGCMDLYEYVGSQPIEWLDSMGLQRHWDDPYPPGEPLRPSVPEDGRPNRAPIDLYPGMTPEQVQELQRQRMRPPPHPSYPDEGNTDQWTEFFYGWHDGAVCWCEGLANESIKFVLPFSTRKFITFPSTWLYDPDNPDLDTSRLMGRVSCEAIAMAAACRASGFNVKCAPHSPHPGGPHQFWHLQFNWWIRNIKGSGGVFRIPWWKG